jgi:hypothetical protein
MDNNPENVSPNDPRNNSPARRVSKRIKLAAHRRVSAASTSIQPADPASPTTASSATTLQTSVPTDDRASSKVPTTSPTPTVPAANLAPSAS